MSRNSWPAMFGTVQTQDVKIWRTYETEPMRKHVVVTTMTCPLISAGVLSNRKKLMTPPPYEQILADSARILPGPSVNS